jgi:hypothetical protein
MLLLFLPVAVLLATQRGGLPSDPSSRKQAPSERDKNGLSKLKEVQASYVKQGSYLWPSSMVVENE